MNYYQFHIGDFRSGTVNMSRKARWIYRDMIDAYYDTEQPLPSDMDVLCDMLGIESDDERKIVERHLRFKFEATEAGYLHEVCEKVIAEYHAKADAARVNGKKGGRPKKNPGITQPNQEVTQENPAGFLNNPALTGLKANQEPRTKNQEPGEPPSFPPAVEKPSTKPATKKTKIPDEFYLTAEMKTWAAESAPAVNLRTETEKFVDYWRAEAKTKADWPATWRNWIRKAQQDANRPGQYRGSAPINRQQQIEDMNNAVVEQIRQEQLSKQQGLQGDLIDLGEVIEVTGERIE